MRSEVISFPCPHCTGKMEIKDSRPTTFRGKNSIRRRRHCKKCGWRVTTFEIIDDGNDFSQVKLPAIISAARQAHRAIENLISRYDTPNEKPLAQAQDMD